MREQEDAIVSRKFQKDGKTVAVYVRKITGGDISGVEYRVDIWPNAQEDVAARVTSGDKYFVRNEYQAKLRQLRDDNWHEDGSGTYGYGDETRFFDPDRG